MIWLQFVCNSLACWQGEVDSESTPVPFWLKPLKREGHTWEREQQKQRQESAKTSLGIQGQGLQVDGQWRGMGLGTGLTLEQSHVWSILPQHLTLHYNCRADWGDPALLLASLSPSPSLWDKASMLLGSLYQVLGVGGRQRLLCGQPVVNLHLAAFNLGRCVAG